MDQDTTRANYAWCWGDTKPGSWRPFGPDMRTNINRYEIDVVQLVQVNIDNGRMRKIKLEDAEDERVVNEDLVHLVHALEQCKL